MTIRNYKGTHPEDGVVFFENKEWIAYIFDEGKKWSKVKVASVDKRDMKANFWLSWNGERFAEGKDLSVIKQHNGELFELVLNAIKFFSHGEA